MQYYKSLRIETGFFVQESKSSRFTGLTLRERKFSLCLEQFVGVRLLLAGPVVIPGNLRYALQIRKETVCQDRLSRRDVVGPLTRSTGCLADLPGR